SLVDALNLGIPVTFAPTAAPAPSPDPERPMCRCVPFRGEHHRKCPAAPAPVSPEPPSREQIAAEMQRVRDAWLVDDTPLSVLHKRTADAVYALTRRAAGSPEPG